MPKIPLYAKGLGSTVELATGRLGPRAASGAFEAVGQATERLARAGGKFGTDFAQNQMRFDDARKKLEFDFQMQRKNEQTKTLSSQFATRAYEESDTYNINNQISDQEKAVSGLVQTVQTPILNEIDGMDITNSQKTSIKDAVLKQMNFKVADAKKQAFRMATIEGGLAKDGEIRTASQELSTSSDLDAPSAFIAKINSIYDDAKLTGQTLSVSRSAAIQEGLRGFYGNGVANAESFASLEKQKELVAEDKNLLSATRQGLLNQIDTKETEIKFAKQEEIIGVLLTANLTPEEQQTALTQLTTKGSQMIAISRDDPADDIIIEFGGAGNKFLTGVAANLKQRMNVANAEAGKSLIQTLFPLLQNMDRDELKAFQAEADSLTGRFEGADVTVAKQLRAEADRYLRTFDVALQAEIKSNTTAIKDVYIANGGVVDDSLQDMIDSTSSKLGQLGDDNPIPRMEFDATVAGFTEAGVVFEGVRFSDNATIVEVQNSLRQDLANAKTAEEALIAKTKQTTFDGFLAQRKAEIESDPVDYIQKYRRDQGQDPATYAELISLQRQMDVADVDIRVASNAELSAFQRQFKDPSLDYNAKSQLGISFITKFGVENEGRVMRNLTNQNVISLSDSLIIANPNNAGMFDVDAANQSQTVKEISSALGKSTMNEIQAEVMSANAEYSGSIIGGMSDSIVSRGATGSRMLHVTAMNTLIKNTAAYYMNAGEADVKTAVSKAVDTVVNSQFAFTEINGKPLRMLKGFEPQASGISDILGFYLSRPDNRDYLASIAQIPPGEGISPQVAEQKYATDLAQGYWVTTSDHKGAYLVDQTGNMVQRRIEMDPFAMGAKSKSIRPDQAFITVRFADLVPMVAEIEAEPTTAGKAAIKKRKIF